MENISFKNYFSSVCRRKLLVFLAQDFVFHQSYFFDLTIQIWSSAEYVPFMKIGQSGTRLFEKCSNNWEKG